MSIARCALVSSLGLLLWHLAVAKEPSPFEKLQVEVKDVIDPFYADIRANYKYRQEEPISPQDMPKWLILYFNEKIGPNKQHVTASVAEQSLDRLSNAFLTDFFYFFPKLSTEVTKENLIYLNQKYFHPRELALTLFKVLVSQDEELFNRFSKILRDDLEIQKREMQKAYEVGTIIQRLYPKASKSQKWEHEIGFAKEYHESKLKDMQERFVKMMELYRLMWSKDQFQELVMEAGCYYLSYFWSFRKNVLPQEDIALSADPKYRADLLRQVDLDPDISRKEHQETVIARWPDSPERRAMLTLFQTLCVEGATDSIAHLKKELLQFEDQVAKTDPVFLPSGGTSEDFREFEGEVAQVEKLPRSWEKPHTLHFMGRDNSGDLIALYSYTFTEEDSFLLWVKVSSDSNRSSGDRIYTIKTLGNMGEKAIPALIKALEDSDGLVRAKAAEALGKMGEKVTTSVISALITALGDNDWRVRTSAAEALGKMGEKVTTSVISALITALGDNDWRVRTSAAEALEKMGEKAIPALSKALEDSDGLVRAKAAEALGKMGEKAIPALSKALEDSDGLVRAKAAEALGKMGEKATPAIPALIMALKDSDAIARIHAAVALVNMGETENAIPALSKALGDSDRAVRVHAAEALGKMGEKAIPALSKALGDSDGLVRAKAAEALGNMGEKAELAIPALIRALGDSDKEVRASAAWALGNIGEKAVAAIPALIKALSDSDEILRSFSAQALGNMGEKAASAIPALSKALGDSDRAVRVHAAEALGNMGKKADAAIPALIRALGDSDEEVHTHAADALQKMGEKGQDALRDWQEKNK